MGTPRGGAKEEKPGRRQTSGRDVLLAGHAFQDNQPFGIIGLSAETAILESVLLRVVDPSARNFAPTHQSITDCHEQCYEQRRK